MSFTSGAGDLDSCTLSGSLQMHDIVLMGAATFVSAARCHFVRNKQCGVSVSQGGKLTAQSCRSANNVDAGFRVVSEGSVMELTDCTSNGDGM